MTRTAHRMTLLQRLAEILTQRVCVRARARMHACELKGQPASAGWYLKDVGMVTDEPMSRTKVGHGPLAKAHSLSSVHFLPSAQEPSSRHPLPPPIPIFPITPHTPLVSPNLPSDLLCQKLT